MNDAIVVGGGPAGLHLAYRLSSAGLNVAVIDDQTYIGEHAVCSGVIGEEAFGRFALPERSVVTKIHTFRAVSPLGKILEHRSPSALARVVKKSEFNKDLAFACREAGVKFHLGCYVTAVQREKHGMAISCRSRHGEESFLRARVAAIASGVKVSLTKDLGLVKPRGFLRAVQAEVVTGKDGAEHPTEIYVGSQVAPGGFGWKIPLGQGRYRIGLMSSSSARPFFSALLERAAPEVQVNSVRLSAKAIAQAPIGKPVADRLLVIGEAAGHIKTSTGGGIYYGLLSAEFASQVLLDAFRRGAFSSQALSAFERYCQSAFGNEIFLGYLLRKLVARFPDSFIEKAFARAKETDFFAKLNGKLSFDWHQRAILASMRMLFDFS